MNLVELNNHKTSVKKDGRMDVRRKYSLTRSSSREQAQNPVISDIVLVETAKKTELKLDVDNGDTEIPLALQNLLTQSDSSGNQIIINPPVPYSAIPSPNSPTSKSAQQFRSSVQTKSSISTDVSINSTDATTESTTSANSGIFRYFLCKCFARKEKNTTKFERTRSTNWARNNNRSSPTNNSYRISLTRVSSMRPSPAIMPVMGEISEENKGKKCLALDLDETLVHSSFQPVKSANYIIPVNIDGTTHNVYVLKRPGVDEFLKKVSVYYEVNY